MSIDAPDLPVAFAGLVRNLARVRVSPEPMTDGYPRWTPTGATLPEDPTSSWLFRATGVSTQLADRAADLRALITAYSQSVASDRPELMQLAQWQRISPSALRGRYDALHVQAVQELLTDDPLIDIVIEPLVSVIDDDLANITPAIDTQLAQRRRMRELAAAQFELSFGTDASKRLGFPRNPADARITRPIADLSLFMTRTLEAHDSELSHVFQDWERRFEARLVKPSDESVKASRIRRARTS